MSVSGCHGKKKTHSKQEWKCNGQPGKSFRLGLTLWGVVEGLISTLSANLTLEGLDLSLAFLADDSKADFRLEDWKEK